MDFLAEKDTPLYAENLPGFLTPQSTSKQPVHGPESHEHPSDWSVMFLYKTQPCVQVNCEQWSSCWGYHSPVDHRRVPRFTKGEFNYEGVKCELEGTHTDCQFSHNTYEVAFHPLNYRTALCKGLKVAGVCYLYGVYCRHAHCEDELRAPVEIYRKRDTSPPASLNVLMELAELRGSLQAKLARVSTLVNRHRSTLACCSCHHAERRYLSSSCGHGLCVVCAQSRDNCAACGESGQLVLLTK